jgi:hypothetical protein
MRHAYMYAGAFEANYSGLKPGAKSYTSTEGDERPLVWPDKIDGVRVSYMERAAKKFYAVRVQHDEHDIVLENPVHIDPARHMNNRRLGPEPLRFPSPTMKRPRCSMTSFATIPTSRRSSR